MRRTISRVAVLVSFGSLGACTSTNPPADPPCVANLTPNCAATYAPPAFQTIFASIIQPNCATGTGTCHTSDFAAGGLVFEVESTSYDLLLGGDASPAYVLPGNPGCSTLMKRLESTDPSYHMPRGPNFLSDGDLCTIVQWIAQGAAP